MFSYVNALEPVSFLPAIYGENSALGVIVGAEHVHSGEQLVRVDKGAYNNQRAQHVPQPEGSGVELIGQVPAQQLTAHAVGEAVGPDQGHDAHSQPGEDQDHQAVVHGFFVIIGAGNGVDLGADLGHDHQAVNAQGDDGQQNEFQQTAVGGQLHGGGSRGRGVRRFHMVSPFRCRDGR